MSQVQAFYEALTKDKTLQEEAKALNGKAAENDEATITKVIVDFAKSKGFTFTEVELKEFLQNQNDELGMEELDAVAGGGNHFCVFGGGAYHCGCVIGGGGKGDNPLICVIFGINRPE